MHNPVLLNEVIHALGEPDHGLYLDATFGAGGYTRALQ
jgi:16S rRNA (cytosine1402-N4)-methyltransferase